MRTVTVAQAAYAAGVIDSDGSIFVRRFALGVTVAQAKPDVVNWLQAIFGGKKCEVKVARGVDYYWQLFDSQEILSFCLAVKPYMVLKRQHVDVAIAIARTLRRKGDSGHARELDPRVKVLRHRLCDLLTDLNKRRSTKEVSDIPPPNDQASESEEVIQ